MSNGVSLRQGFGIWRGNLRSARVLRRLAILLLLSLAAPAYAQPGISKPSETDFPQPQGGASYAVVATGPEGLIQIDAVVKDRSGKPVASLSRGDFTLRDNGRNSPIVSFHVVGGIPDQSNPPVAITLLIDTRGVPRKVANEERSGVEEFLLHNGGRLGQPVRILRLDQSGLWLVAGPSTDGTDMASAVAHGAFLEVIRAPGVFVQEGEMPANSGAFDFQPAYIQDPPIAALEAIGSIATAAKQEPGRKLLLWVGPGFGIGSGAYPSPTNPREKQDIFAKMYWFSTLLREARVTLDVFSVGARDSGNPTLREQWKASLEGAHSVEQASAMNLYKNVLAIESGGQVFPPDGSLARHLDDCVQETSVFYTLTFNPLSTRQAHEYHTLRLEMREPGMTAHTTTGYYDEPFYADAPDAEVRRITPAQLEQIVASTREESDGQAARQLSQLELTEPLEGARLVSLTAELRGKKARDVLTALADASAFSDAPTAEITGQARPNASEQRHILALAAAYLERTIPKLPNFFATRVTEQYGETPAYDEGNTRIRPVLLHVVARSKSVVLYRHGAEVVDAIGRNHTQGDLLYTYGTFGPVLNAVQGALHLPGAVTWSRWEEDPRGKRAVFLYVVPPQRSMYFIEGCCLPIGDGLLRYAKKPGYHGEIAIDPASGAILRVEIEADLAGFAPLLQSNILVTYGPVAIGGETYILPLHSVSVLRKRTVPALGEWHAMFNTWGPYATSISDFTFDHYHVFHAESRILNWSGQTP